jgi:hypothetical protein
MSRLRGLGTVVALLAFVLPGCPNSREDAEIEKVEFGVPFGGDVQDRGKIPRDLEPPELALRVRFRAPVARERSLSWELERPSAARASDGGVLYEAELGELHVPVGERQIDAKLGLRARDREGVYRLHVRLEGRVILERTFEVFDRSR